MRNFNLIHMPIVMNHQLNMNNVIRPRISSL